MTLLVHTFVHDEPGKLRLLDDPEDGGDMAGFESSRTKLWGSEPARALGARFLPRLADDDLYVQPEDVEEFLAECELLRGHTAEPRCAQRLPGGLRGGPARQHHPGRTAGPVGGRRGAGLVSGDDRPGTNGARAPVPSGDRRRVVAGRARSAHSAAHGTCGAR